MMRRLAVIAVAVGSLLAGGSAAQAVIANSPHAGGYIACAGLDISDHSICLKNPIPPRPPAPPTYDASVAG